MIERILNILGVELYRISHTERLVSALGAFTGILVVIVISTVFLTGNGPFLVVASMGASAVLLFAVPHGTLSQPWALVGGHLISAFIGVSCARFVPDIYIAAPLAVGLAVGAMHYLRCIHPPGGATALAAVVGGSAVMDLGYGFVVTPVALNVAAILGTAVLFNYLFAWRRYPSYLNRRKLGKTHSKDARDDGSIAHEEFVYALSEIDTFIDVTEDDLLRIYELVTQSREAKGFDPSELKLGSYYSNGSYGNEWSVRQIIDWAEDQEPDRRKLIFKVVAGAGRRSTGFASIQEFAQWAKHEVYRDEVNWRRLPRENICRDTAESSTRFAG